MDKNLLADFSSIQYASISKGTPGVITMKNVILFLEGQKPGGYVIASENCIALDTFWFDHNHKVFLWGLSDYLDLKFHSLFKTCLNPKWIYRALLRD